MVGYRCGSCHCLQMPSLLTSLASQQNSNRKQQQQQQASNSARSRGEGTQGRWGHDVTLFAVWAPDDFEEDGWHATGHGGYGSRCNVVTVAGPPFVSCRASGLGARASDACLPHASLSLGFLMLGLTWALNTWVIGNVLRSIPAVSYFTYLC